MHSNKLAILNQIIRYGFVGLCINTLGYLIYLLVTHLGLAPKTAITFFYPLGLVIAYLSHSRYSFKYKMSIKTAIQYVLVYLLAYIINYTLLTIFTDQIGLPHQFVQVLAIFVVASVVFVMLKYLVFKTEE